MKNRSTKLKALLFVVFMISMTLVGTMPMIMGDGTDGGGGGGTWSRVYATDTYDEEDGGLVGHMYTSGSCNYRCDYAGCDACGYKWIYEFTVSQTTTVSVYYMLSWNMKAYGYSDPSWSVYWSILLRRTSYPASTLLGQNDMFMSRSYPWDPNPQTATGYESNYLRDNSGTQTTVTLYPGATYEIRFTVGISMYNSRLYKTTGWPNNAYSNAVIYLISY